MTSCHNDLWCERLHASIKDAEAEAAAVLLRSHLVTELSAPDEERPDSVDALDVGAISVNADSGVIGWVGGLAEAAEIPEEAKLTGSLPDDTLRALIACEIVALARYARYGCNPQRGAKVTPAQHAAWLAQREWQRTPPALLAMLYGRIGECLAALRYPDARKAWFDARQSRNKKDTRAWFTELRIEACRSIIRRRGIISAKEIFEALKEEPHFARTGMPDVILTEHPSNSRTKDFTLSALEATLTAYADEIGWRKGGAVGRNSKSKSNNPVS